MRRSYRPDANPAPLRLSFLDAEVALIEAQGAPLAAHRFAQHIAAALERG
ncbi:hypothetical protein [Stakelama pacifica]|nr:hypothetical protein [Stakelama pacifica]